MKMYVGNLSFETTENDLQDLFEQHGTVNEVHLMMDRLLANRAALRRHHERWRTSQRRDERA